jgi:hypothetical protein
MGVPRGRSATGPGELLPGPGSEMSKPRRHLLTFLAPDRCRFIIQLLQGILFATRILFDGSSARRDGPAVPTPLDNTGLGLLVAPNCAGMPARTRRPQVGRSTAAASTLRAAPCWARGAAWAPRGPRATGLLRLCACQGEPRPLSWPPTLGAAALLAPAYPSAPAPAASLPWRRRLGAARRVRLSWHPYSRGTRTSSSSRSWRR